MDCAWAWCSEEAALAEKPTEAAAMCTRRGSGLGEATSRGVRRSWRWTEDEGLESLSTGSGVDACWNSDVGCWRCLGGDVGS